MITSRIIPVVTEALYNAHRAKESIDWRAYEFLPDIASSMMVQAEVSRRLGVQVSGWKVAIAQDGSPIAAPLSEHRMFESGVSARVPLLPHTGIEVEIGFILKSDLPARPNEPYGRNEVIGSISEVLVGIEVVQSRLGDYTKAPLPLLLADNLGNGAYIKGDAIAFKPELDLSSPHCSVELNGVLCYDALGRHPAGDPLQPLIAYASNQSDRLGGLKAGQIITTGSMCGLISPAPTAGAKSTIQVSASLEGIGNVHFNLVA